MSVAAATFWLTEETAAWWDGRYACWEMAETGLGMDRVGRVCWRERWTGAGLGAGLMGAWLSITLKHDEEKHDLKVAVAIVTCKFTLSVYESEPCRNSCTSGFMVT